MVPLSSTNATKIIFGLIDLVVTVALWLERPPRERKVVGSIPGRDRQKPLKTGIVLPPPPPPPPFSAQHHGNSTTIGPPVSG